MTTTEKIQVGNLSAVTRSETSFYPISVADIAKRVAKRNGRKEAFRKANGCYQTRLSLLEETQRDNVKQIVNNFGERIVRVDGDIPVNIPVINGDRYLFISYDQTALTHGIHKYPAKFFPELPRWLIRRYSCENDYVLDPFSGSGTTSVEALLLHRNSVGIDVDPFSRFLSKVKVTPLHENELLYSKLHLLQQVANYHHSNVQERDIPVFPYRDNWFNKEITLELAYLKKVLTLWRSVKPLKTFSGFASPPLFVQFPMQTIIAPGR